MEKGLEVKYVNPRKTSSTYPTCGNKLKDNVAICMLPSKQL
ncbi:MAG: hypothetical protein QXV06_03485 [Ignisphaera sp.]